MMAERNRIASSKRGVSPKKKSAQTLKPKAMKPKPAWDSFLVPDTAYKLDPKKLLEKKNNLVSKHNIFVNENDVTVGYRPQSVLKERHPNLTSPHHAFSPTLEKEKKESDALDLIMSTKEKEVGRAVSQKSPAKTRGTSSFAPPTKPVRPKGLKAKNQEESEPTEHDELTEIEANEGSVHEFDQSTQLFGQSERRIHSTVAEVVKDQRQHLLQQKTAELAQRLNSPDSAPFTSTKDSVSVNKTTKSIRTPSPHRSGTKVNTSEKDVNSSTLSGSAKFNTPKTSAKVNTPTTSHTTDKDYDLLYVADEIRSLFSELKYYEELSGRKSILDTREELEDMLQDKALLNPESHKPVMRYLVQLVCQSMTYLLKSEVDLQEERGRYELLNTKFETLNALLAEDSVIPGVAELRGGSSNGVVGSNVEGNCASGSTGIAYVEDDLYPSQFTSPVHNTHTATTNNTTPYTTTTNTTNPTPYSTTRHDAPSPSLKMIAQQYANDDLYPIPVDSEHSLHYDDVDYDSYEASFVVENVKSTPMTKTSSSTANNTSNMVHGAKVTSTPARFHETIATLSSTNTTEHRANKLAMNAPPNMLLSTPVRSVGGSTVYGGASSVYNGSGGVSSTATTPQVMPYTTHTHNTHTNRDYTALGVYSPNAMTTPTSANTSSYYTQLNSPAVYVDAYSSYLPSAPSSRAEGRVVDNNNTDITNSSGDVMATPTRQTITATMQVGLARVDELIEYSRSIADTSGASGIKAVDTSVSNLGDEYSTIVRLSNYKHTANTTNANAEHSMIADTSYSVHNHHASAANVSNTSNSAMDMSVNSVDATPARVRPQNTYTHLYGSVESHLPPPPPTSHYTTSSTNNTSSNSKRSPNDANDALYVRQPNQASAATAQLQRTNTTNTISTTTKYVSSGDSVHSVQSTSSSMQGLTGASASDWLFGAFSTTAPNNTTTSSTSKGRNVMVGTNIGGTSVNSSITSNTATPESHYVAPTTTVHTLPTTPYTTAHTHTHSNVVTPTREVLGLNKTHTPGTADLYKSTTSMGLTTPTNNTNITSMDTTTSTSPPSYNTTTPPPTAAVPTYLLHKYNSPLSSTTNTTNTTKSDKSSSKVTAAGLVQVRSTTRLPSPMKGTKSSRIPLKSEAVSIIVPNSSLPSPQSAPVHPFATSSVTPHSNMQHKLHSLQHHTQHYEQEYSNSNATTPILTLEPWHQVQKRVYDARNGSF